MIYIVDYGMGNLGSIRNMLKKIGVESLWTSDAEQLEQADRLILPGVGAFDNGMQKLHELGLVSVLNRRVLEAKRPILGICLGMQLMTRCSQEGKRLGLGWIDAETVRFAFKSDTHQLRIPHMGWNTVSPTGTSVLFSHFDNEPRFYFVHSYHPICRSKDDVIALTQYGYEFVSAFRHDNIFGVQFHPEKSHKYGMTLLKNFAEAT